MKRPETLTNDKLFPRNYSSNPFPEYCQILFKDLAAAMPERDLARVPGWLGPGEYQDLVEHYSCLPERTTSEPPKIIREIARDLLAGAVNWRSPDLLYNLGAAVNVAAAAIYALALDVNVYLINDGLAGNCILAEAAVGNILADLADVPRGMGHGVFTFGGTGTNLYAIKIGTRKLRPDSGEKGLPSNISILVTEDAHFSHAAAADWAGIGTDNLIVIKAGHERRSDIADAEARAREALQSGHAIPAMLINGGTTYDHTVDDIEAFISLRERLRQEYKLNYLPHLHVDSVIGWIWLVFKNYNFDTNPLEIDCDALDLIRAQYERIKKINLADSWGVDFHKGAGACPIDCSFVMLNNRLDLLRLKKGSSPITSMHQLADDFSYQSPVDYTLETSRAGGKALAALASLHTLGEEGYQAIIGHLMEMTVLLRREIGRRPDMRVLNSYALGYQTMVRLYPPEVANHERVEQELVDADNQTAEFVSHGNKYLKDFFTWDNSTRMDVNAGGVVYSFSKKFVKTPSGVDISGLKFYIVSPRIDKDCVYNSIIKLEQQKRYFDQNVWNRK